VDYDQKELLSEGRRCKLVIWRGARVQLHMKQNYQGVKTGEHETRYDPRDQQLANIYHRETTEEHDECGRRNQDCKASATENRTDGHVQLVFSLQHFGNQH